MAVEACNEPKIAVDMDEDDDDKPIVFRRNSSSSKQNRLNQDTNTSDTGARSIPKSDLQNRKMVSPSKAPGGTRVQNSSEEPSNDKYFSSVTCQSSDKLQGRDDKQPVETEDSEDDKPLSLRASKFNSTKANQNTSKGLKTPKSEDSGDKMPLSSQFKGRSNTLESTKNSSTRAEKKPLLGKSIQNGSVSADRKPLNALKKRSPDSVKISEESNSKKPKYSGDVAGKDLVKPRVKEEDDEEDDIPISQRLKKAAASEKKQVSAHKLNKPVSAPFKKKTDKKPEKAASKSQYSKSSKVPPSSGEGQKWTTLVHNGVIFPPPYKPHGVKMLYKGKSVDLTPEQEEVATMYAVMRESDYVTKDQFNVNFMNDWRKILGKNHIIQSLEHCDFTPIYEWHQKEKEKKKLMTSEEKKALREEKLKQEEKYMWAIVDGVKEKVGNFRVEPPGLFRGRGEHPKMGRLKKRIHPRDIIINIGRDAPIPECPIPGESWKEVRHDNTVTWLAYWNDPINPKEFKYVFLAASSTLKGQSDKEKYEKARKLKDYILGIRATYAKDFTSKDPTKKQIAVATYLIDKLALRAGNEKDDDEADTVGCCTLKVENVEPVPPNILKFDFLGKDSIKYENEVEVEIPVFKAIQQFRSGKKGGDDLFDKLDTSKLNAHLKELMPGLTAKVFRTYNASITLDEMLSRETKGGTVAEKVVVYQHANKEVAIICNHQRTVSKSHGAQMLRLEGKLNELKGVLEELKTDLSRAKKGKPPLKSPDGKSKRNLNPDVLERKIEQTTARIQKMERDIETKEDLKTVALGTSKINYLDPRITVAWCKRHEVPIEKIFNKSLLAKFTWAMDVDPSFRF